ncbi:MSH2 protein [Malassezia caprae]|uniref:DNA mismatch repair protein MSH2 n=1 Tax=Malassezia caprae TaxID=1381934 RepID=A0AAF0E954_9BASI|nr:MSH2 protein [Malassezia caprae]
MSGLMYPTEESRQSASRSDSEKSDTNFVSFYEGMPRAIPGTIRLFDRQEYYTVHGDDALFVADTVFRTQSVLRYLGGKGKDHPGLPSCSLNPAAAKSFLRDALTSKQLRIEIWCSTSGDGSGRRSGSWAISKQASPGNLQEVEDLLFLNADVVSSPMVLALRVKAQDGLTTVGVAFADATNREMGVCEYAENDLFSNTESLIIQLGVKECLLPGDETSTDYDINKMQGLLERCGCVISKVKRTQFSSKSIEEDMQRLLPVSEKALLPELDKKLAMSAAAALVSYLRLLEDESNFGKFALRTHDLSEYLRLDHAALKALSLFPESQGGSALANKHASLYGLLNRCKTAQGNRMLSQWLKQPLVNVHAIQNRQSLLSIFMEESELRHKLQDEFLRYMPDMLRISKRFQRSVATLEDVVRCYQAVVKIPELQACLAEVPVGSEADRTLFHSTFAAPLDELFQHLSKLVEMVEMTIDLDELAYHNYVIKPEFDDGLRAIKAKLDQIRDQFDEQHVKAGNDLRLDTEKKLHLENHSSYGYCFRVTRTGGLYFTTSAMRELNDDFRSLSDEYARTQSRLVKDVIDIASSYAPPLEQLNVVLAHLDVILSLAQVSSNAPIPYTRPQILERGADLLLVDSRHPCLEVQDDVNFIPNNVSMVSQKSEFLLVTGPNMGGKSTYLRQIGIITLMAQIGCFVPAAEGAQVPICDCILARVGAGDSQLKGISTFMAEMLETATILKTATKDSLVLIDELGRGTSTYDGFGLAWAISEWIVTHIHCKCVFATHFHELTNLARQQPGVQNLHMVAYVAPRDNGSRFDKDITLLYKVEEGVSNQSYGIQIAELADFPESVIRLAKRKAEELEGFDDHQQAMDMPGDVAETGVALVQEFMTAWRERTEGKRQKMDETEAQKEALDSCMKDFDERIRNNVRCVITDLEPWTAKVMENF